MLKVIASIICTIIFVVSLNSHSYGQSRRKPISSWVKLCDYAKTGIARGKRICLTHHERLNGDNGMVLVSAAVRKIPGVRKERFMIMVPRGMALAPGVQIKIDNNRPHKFPYSICQPAGCVAEKNLTPRLLRELKTGNRLIIAAINRRGKAIGFPIPLRGFSAAYRGRSIDPKIYHRSRKRLLRQIKRRRSPFFGNDF